MNIRRWNAKRLSLVACISVILYIVFSNGSYEYRIDAVINDTRPEDVLEYVADFSKMRLLNPTILNFEIISESGNAHDWRYTVVYTEKLAYWPYHSNTATAEYTVTKSMPDVKPATYSIESKHRTCFLKDAFCLNAKSDFKFSALGKDTYCEEYIQYQCPLFLKSACRRELEYQRKAVMHNLTTIFSKKH